MLWANLNVGYHIWNILEDEELQADSVIKDSLITASDGKSYRTKLYNIDFNFLPLVAENETTRKCAYNLTCFRYETVDE